MSIALAAGGAALAPPEVARKRRRRRPIVVASASGLVVAVLVLPLAFLVLRASQAGWATIFHLLLRRLTLTLLVHTVELAAVVTAGTAFIGTACAWATERTTVPGRRIWSVLVVLPIAVPDFVIAYGWESIAPSLRGFFPSALVLTFGLYPLVYLPVAAAFRSVDPAQEEVARSRGLGPLSTFLRVTLHQARLALMGGCLVVALYMLAEYGAFAIFRYQSFTTEIFTQFEVGFNTPAASALSLVLVTLGIVVLAGEAAASRGIRIARPSTRARLATRRVLSWPSSLAVSAGLFGVAAVSIGVPSGAIAYWMITGTHRSAPFSASLTSAAWHTAAYGASAACGATLMALPVAIFTVRHRGRLALFFERSGMLVQALPGLVVALSLVFFAVRYAHAVYQTSALLVAAYAVMFFPLALVAMRASVARVPRQLEEMARSLGSRPVVAFARVTLPLMGPGLIAAFCLVFLTSVTELTATLILVPTGVQTLATQFWQYTSSVSYASAAPFAAAMLGVAVVPTFLLGRWFDRLPSRSPVAS